MIQHTFQVIALLAAWLALASVGYYALCVWSAASFARSSTGAPESVSPTPALPVSILKPLKGPDPEMYESFRSQCRQDYSEYEIIFGVSERDDPAIELVERLKAEFPQRRIELVVCEKRFGNNIKVSNLIQMLPYARYDHLIVNDSDIRVESKYLRRVMAPLSDEKVGMATCLYRGVAEQSLGSRLEALGIATDFIPGVLTARKIEGIKFGLGSTMAFRRRELDAVGGFEALRDFLADDFQLGRMIAERGFEIVVPDVEVETFLPRYTLAEYFAHQLRWARAVRDSRFWGYVGLGVSFGLAWAALALVFSAGAWWAWGLLALTLGARLAMASFVAGVLRDRQSLRRLWLLPLRDLAAFLVWMVSFAGHTVKWRGQIFRLKNGKLT